MCVHMYAHTLYRCTQKHAKHMHTDRNGCVSEELMCAFAFNNNTILCILRGGFDYSRKGRLMIQQDTYHTLRRENCIGKMSNSFLMLFGLVQHSTVKGMPESG